MMKIDLTYMNEIKEFVAAAQSCTAEVLLVSGKYTINAKSILGIFSLDLSYHIDLVCEDESDYPKFERWLVTALEK